MQCQTEGRVGVCRVHELVVAGWRGGTWGLRVPKAYRGLFAQYRHRLEQKALVVALPGAHALLPVRLSPSFWRRCPEIRAAEFGRWMCSRGDAPWPHGQPPKYRASLVAGQEIVLQLE